MLDGVGMLQTGWSRAMPWDGDAGWDRDAAGRSEQSQCPGMGRCVGQGCRRQVRARASALGWGRGTLGGTGTLQAGQSRANAPAMGSKEERAAPEQSVGGISSRMFCGRSPGHGRLALCHPHSHQPGVGLGCPGWAGWGAGRVGGSQAGETEALSKHAVSPWPPSQQQALRPPQRQHG